MKWTLIENLGNSKIARSSYYWFFLIPLIAKFLQKIPEKIEFDYMSIDPISLNLIIPFSWYLLFAAGGLFIVSNLVYRAACPHIIREFRNFSEFTLSGYPISYILAQASHQDLDEKDLDELINSSPISQARRSGNKLSQFEIEYKFKNAQEELFDKTYNKANSSKKWIRFFATFIISLAIGLIGIIAIQNILAVVEMYQKG